MKYRIVKTTTNDEYGAPDEISYTVERLQSGKNRWIAHKENGEYPRAFRDHRWAVKFVQALLDETSYAVSQEYTYMGEGK